jgi:ribosomal protein S18 acetylase RimI-like enzyme
LVSIGNGYTARADEILTVLRIVPAVSADDVERVRVLFREYERALGVDLSYQGFGDEVASLPGAYAPPRGALFLAMDGDDASGCVALRPLGEDLCEMKRLYLRASLRGRGAGRALAQRVIDQGRAIGYRAMRLDSLPGMKEAIALYETLGFTRIPAYYPSPVPGTVYMERRL